MNEKIAEVLRIQYGKSLNILQKAIEKYDNNLWNNMIDYKSPVWQIVYHSLFYTNIYCSQSEEEILHWEKEKEDYHNFDKGREMRNENNLIPYNIREMLEYLKFIRNNIPQYLITIKPEKKCWPFWYNETQMEFHINNIRHLQHHTAEIIERHDIFSEFEYVWE